MNCDKQNPKQGEKGGDGDKSGKKKNKPHKPNKGAAGPPPNPNKNSKPNGSGGGNNSHTINSAEFECPVCCEIMRAPIYVCESGHSICGDCCKKITPPNCPLCQAPIRQTRNFTLEAMIEKIKLPCPNKAAGCSYSVMQGEIDKHVVECIFRTTDCIFGIVFGKCSWNAEMVADGVSSLVPEAWLTNGSTPNTVELCSDDPDYHVAVAHMKVHQHKVTVKQVLRNEHALMYAHFLLRIEETKLLAGSARIHILLHDTAAAKVPSILTNNLDWRRSLRVRYGKGVSFSRSADYAMKYSNRGNGSNRAMLVTEVVVGKEMDTDDSFAFPPKGFDTTSNPNGNVVVKYKDDEFFIKYVIFYTLNQRY